LCHSIADSATLKQHQIERMWSLFELMHAATALALLVSTPVLRRDLWQVIVCCQFCFWRITCSFAHRVKTLRTHAVQARTTIGIASRARSQCHSQVAVYMWCFFLQWFLFDDLFCFFPSILFSVFLMKLTYAGSCIVRTLLVILSGRCIIFTVKHINIHCGRWGMNLLITITTVICSSRFLLLLGRK